MAGYLEKRHEGAKRCIQARQAILRVSWEINEAMSQGAWPASAVLERAERVATRARRLATVEGERMCEVRGLLLGDRKEGVLFSGAEGETAHDAAVACCATYADVGWTVDRWKGVLNKAWPADHTFWNYNVVDAIAAEHGMRRCEGADRGTGDVKKHMVALSVEFEQAARRAQEEDPEFYLKDGHLFVRGRLGGLTGQSVLIFELFMQQQGRVVTEEELIKKFWRGASQAESRLTSAIHKLRKDLKKLERPDVAERIKHVGPGYRFV